MCIRDSRIVTDSARITKNWFDGLKDQGLKPEEYVEILGTIVHTFAVDEFCRGLGIPLNELPEPKAGKPSGYLPENASYDGGAWVPLLPHFIEEGPEEAIGRLISKSSSNSITGLKLQALIH